MGVVQQELHLLAWVKAKNFFFNAIRAMKKQV